MTTLIDTHCHLGDPAFDADRGEVVGRMRAAGVSRALVIESELDRLETTLEWVRQTDGMGLATGCHPHDASAWSPAMAIRLERLWRSGDVRAAGEMGLDYHYDHAPREVQRRVFDAQLGLATACGLPVVIHAREADAEIVEILEDHPAATVILHSFSSGAVLREAGLEHGWYFSFSGMVTFKSWRDQETVRAVSADRLLVETDAPYLAPVPHRGHRNEPAHVVAVATEVATLREISLDEACAITSTNAMRLFWDGQPT